MTFSYDSEHCCLSKTSHREGISETRFFLYEGQQEVGALDEQLNLRELRLLGASRRAVALELEGELYAPVHDLQGNIAVLKGKKSSAYFYSAFGEERLEGEGKSPWRFSAKRSDEETGLVFFGRRFYSPALGRWLTPDPAGFADGMNLYAFVHNDPLTHFDEVGLFSVPLSGTCFLYEQRNQATNAFLSHVTHEAYANFYVPLASEMDCYSRFTDRWMGRPLSERPWSEERMWQERKTIDRFFGTHFAERDLALRTSGIQFSQLEISTPSSLVSVAGKTSQIGRFLFSPIQLSKISRNETTFAGRILTRTKIRSYLSNLESINKNQIISDLESIGLKVNGKSPDGCFFEFRDKFGNTRIKIHPPDKITPYHHLHIYDKTGNSFDKNLEIVSKRSVDAHIRYGGE